MPCLRPGLNACSLAPGDRRRSRWMGLLTQPEPRARLLNDGESLIDDVLHHLACLPEAQVADCKNMQQSKEGAAPIIFHVIQLNPTEISIRSF